ncbi:MAG: CHAD domain-containing protein [Sphingobium sp.]|nr:CHAD domain-containing protein [Sphingobium sp.]
MKQASRFRKKDKSVEAGFRRIAVEEIDVALAMIAARGRSLAEKIHKVRRQTKAVRALLHLVRGSFGPFRRENRAFRDIARALSGSRDARVMLDTFDAITRRPDGRLPRGLMAARERLLSACGDPADAEALLAAAHADLLSARERVRTWSLADDGWAALSHGFEHSYRHARETMRAAIMTGDAKASHEWRKGVKYLGGQARLLRRMKPGRLKADIKVATRLGDLLGARHDIDLFLDTMAQAPARFGDIVTITQIAALARLRLVRLDRQSRRLGETLLAEKPAKLAERWGDWWKDWRDDD